MPVPSVLMVRLGVKAIKGTIHAHEDHKLKKEGGSPKTRYDKKGREIKQGAFYKLAMAAHNGLDGRTTTCAEPVVIGSSTPTPQRTASCPSPVSYEETISVPSADPPRYEDIAGRHAEYNFDSGDKLQRGIKDTRAAYAREYTDDCAAGPWRGQPTQTVQPNQRLQPAVVARRHSIASSISSPSSSSSDDSYAAPAGLTKAERKAARRARKNERKLRKEMRKEQRDMMKEQRKADKHARKIDKMRAKLQ